MSETAIQNIIEETFARYKKYLNPGMAELVKFMGLDTVEYEAEGCYVTDIKGQRLLDCLGGPGVFTMGHRHPRIVAAVRNQLERMPLGSHLLLSEVTALAAERIAQITPGDLQYSFFVILARKLWKRL